VRKGREDDPVAGRRSPGRRVRRADDERDKHPQGQRAQPHAARQTTCLPLLVRRSARRMNRFAIARRLISGSYGGIAGAVYGTIIAMAPPAAGSTAEPDPWRLAAIVVTTVLVLWAAHVYSHALAESIDRGRRVDGAELSSIARRELSIPLAAVA